MKIAPLVTSDPWFSHVFNHGKAYVETLDDVPVEATVMMEHASLAFGVQAQQFRPHLQLVGQVISVRTPQVELPYDVTEMEFSPGTGPKVNALYSFSNEQLAELVRKGYFEQGFVAPPSMVGIPWELPLSTRAVFVLPDGNDEPPVVFLDFKDLASLSLDEKQSGYDLAAYFPEIAPQVELETEVKVDQLSLDAESHFAPSAQNDLFGSERALAARDAQEVTAALEDVPAEPASSLYDRNIGRRLRDAREFGGSALRKATDDQVLPDPRIQSSMPVFDDGFLAFELEDGVLPEGEIDYDTEYLDLSDLDADEEYVKPVLEPHQRASVAGEWDHRSVSADLDPEDDEPRHAAKARVARLAALQAESQALAGEESPDVKTDAADLEMG